MKSKLALKTLFRSPVRMILTFILLVAVTFTLFSQVLEHAVTVREIEKAEETYDGIGAVSVSDEICETGYSYYLALDPRVAIDENMIRHIKINNMLLGGSIYQYEPLTQEQINTMTSLPYVTETDVRYMTAGISDEFVRLDE
ncbi:MAG: hypothetical protein IJO77_01565, partial [Oscillospiraceae bacterium]|nr:hypothetical protein [Oscillospiraceae bacterium]